MLCIHKREGNNPYFFIPSSLEKRLCNISFSRRKKLIKKYRQRLKNNEFSIICDNCYGGIISHELGVQQQSPFVNLIVHGDDMLKLLKNLDYYLSLELVDGGLNTNNYPTGMLDDVNIIFVHYKSFKEAKDAWARRVQRIHKDRMLVLVSDSLDDRGMFMPNSMIREFLELDYKHLFIITNDKNKKRISDKVIYMKKYKSNHMFFYGNIELFSPLRCVERYIDIVDVLNQLND